MTTKPKGDPLGNAFSDFLGGQRYKVVDVTDKCRACNGDGVWHQERTTEHPTPPVGGGWEKEFSNKFCGTGRFTDYESYIEVLDFIQSELSDQKTEDYLEIREELKRIALKFAPDGEYPVGFWDEVWQLLDEGRGG